MSNSSARKYSQSQERDRTPSLEGRPNLSNASGGALPVPLARGVPPERGLLSAHAIGEAAPPRAPLQKRPPGGLGFPAGAARPVTPSRASNRTFAPHGTYHKHCSDKRQRPGMPETEATGIILTPSRTVSLGFEMGLRAPRISITPDSIHLLAVLLALLVRTLEKRP